MAEEATAIAFSALTKAPLWQNGDALVLLDREGRDLDETTRWEQLERGLNALASLQPALDTFAQERSKILASAHVRARQALGSKAQVNVNAVSPLDIIGFYVLMPCL